MNYVKVVGLIILILQKSRTFKGENITSTEGLHVYSIELLVVVDYSIYKYWLERQNQNGDTSTLNSETATSDIYQHYVHVVNTINDRFTSIDSIGWTINVVLTNVIIQKNVTQSVWLDKTINENVLDAEHALSSFRNWLGLTHDVPKHDHAMLFTRYDLFKDDSRTIAGLAYIASLCTSRSVSVVEDMMSTHTYTVAVHEVAHSLGAQHDGFMNQCSSLDNYIMADTSRVTADIDNNRNSWHFSECSVTYFEMYIGMRNAKNTNCLLETDDTDNDVDNDTTTAEPDTTHEEKIPTPDEQCQNSQGDGSFLCRNLYTKGYQDICALMYCSVDDSKCNFRLPMDGTKCGTNKVCQFGFCKQYGDITPALGSSDIYDINTCPFGDQPGTLALSGRSCRKSTEAEPYQCYNRYFASRCCASCGRLLTNVTGCEYGDKADHCVYIGRIECLFHDNECCTTCARYAETMSELILHLSLGAGGFVTFIIIVIACIRIRRNTKRNRAKSKTKNGHRNQAELNQNKCHISIEKVPKHIPLTDIGSTPNEHNHINHRLYQSHIPHQNVVQQIATPNLRHLYQQGKLPQIKNSEIDMLDMKPLYWNALRQMMMQSPLPSSDSSSTAICYTNPSFQSPD